MVPEAANGVTGAPRLVVVVDARVVPEAANGVAGAPRLVVVVDADWSSLSLGCLEAGCTIHH